MTCLFSPQVPSSINEDNSLTFSDSQLLSQLSDVDGDSLTIDSVSYSGTEGVFTDHGNGSYTFAPNENFNGDLSFDMVVRRRYRDDNESS
ncbi:cadherin-like domain-containing protein [Vibrio sp. SS-MA-C1-2]|uniref:cadherin-like domain-containing protein n=1 Tax=Vibrio sp. SS-MA-C1-2 TaxID=2908646 RepID=UPI0038FCECBA